MAKRNSFWKKGRGRLGMFVSLLGTWKANSNSPMGKVTCTRTFSSVLNGRYIQLNARWHFTNHPYEELAIFGLQNGKISFRSFASDGRQSYGEIADGSDVHREAICFHSNMPAGLARMIFWPHEDGGFKWAVESKTKKGWKRFVEHHYHLVDR